MRSKNWIISWGIAYEKGNNPQVCCIELQKPTELRPLSLCHLQLNIVPIRNTFIMVLVTLRVLQGADRGRVFPDLRPPITIGREEGNTIQLNDERVSRCHLKIQEDNDRLVLTDLDSTNGTKINGQDCQLRLLRFGDIIAVGRSVLLFGNREQIADRLQELSAARGEDLNNAFTAEESDEIHPDMDVSTGLSSSLGLLGRLESVPSIPERLSPSQAAQLSEILEHLHAGLQYVIDGVQADPHKPEVVVPPTTWQVLLQLQGRLAEMIRNVADPEKP